MVILIIFVFQKNDTANLPTYTMYTGEGNPYNLSEIYLVNGKSSLEKWGGKSPEQQDNACNVVRGSDGSTFNPYLQKVRRQITPTTDIKDCILYRAIDIIRINFNSTISLGRYVMVFQR